MKTSTHGIKFIKDKEGEVLHAYQDSRGVWTIGVGHTKGVKKGQVITSEQSTQFLISDLAEAESAVNRLVKVPLTQNQFDALVSFVFNLGEGNLRTSTLLRKLNAKDYVGASNGFLPFNKEREGGKLVYSEGLARRRKLEQLLFLS